MEPKPWMSPFTVGWMTHTSSCRDPVKGDESGCFSCLNTACHLQWFNQRKLVNWWLKRRFSQAKPISAAPPPHYKERHQELTMTSCLTNSPKLTNPFASIRLAVARLIGMFCSIIWSCSKYRRKASFVLGDHPLKFKTTRRQNINNPKLQSRDDSCAVRFFNSASPFLSDGIFWYLGTSGFN